MRDNNTGPALTGIRWISELWIAMAGRNRPDIDPKPEVAHEPPLSSEEQAEDSRRRMERALNDMMQASQALVDPVLCVRQASLAMEAVARRRGVDLLRPFHIAMPSLKVERGPLLSLLKSMLQNALEATPSGGAVICAVRVCDERVYFIVSDSSGQDRDGAVLVGDSVWRNEAIGAFTLVAEALGGRLIHTDHPGEGMVMELSFARPEAPAERRDKVQGHLSRLVSNDDTAVARKPERETAI